MIRTGKYMSRFAFVWTTGGNREKRYDLFGFSGVNSSIGDRKRSSLMSPENK
jgi:hypothetical protein